MLFANPHGKKGGGLSFQQVSTNLKLVFFRLAVALLTLVVGVTITKFFRATNRLSLESGARKASSQFPFPVTVPETNTQSKTIDLSDEKADPFEAAFIDGDKLSYAGYDVERVTDASNLRSWAIIKKKGRTIARLGNAWLGKDSTKFGLFSLLRGQTKQLIILQYTGGAHCCWVYKIYDFRPHLQLIFDDEKYGDSLGYELHPVDIDGDGLYELTQAVMTFDYFHMSHASSVFPTAVLAFDERSHRYRPANRKFPSYLLDDIEDDVRRLESAKNNFHTNAVAPDENYLSAVLGVFLKSLYAGRKSDAWQFFKMEYRLSNKHEIRADIETALRSDPIYRSIYVH